MYPPVLTTSESTELCDSKVLALLAQGKRYALPNTRIMLHHPSGSARGQASDIHNEARELMRLRNYVNQVLCQATGQPIEKVCTFSWIPLKPAAPMSSWHR